MSFANPRYKFNVEAEPIHLAKGQARELRKAFEALPPGFELRMRDGGIFTGTIRESKSDGRGLVTTLRLDVDLVHYSGWGSLKRVTCETCWSTILRLKHCSAGIRKDAARMLMTGAHVGGRVR